MKFERLKKSHKKQIVMGALAICVIGSALTFVTTKAKYKLTQSIDLVKGTINYKPYDFKIMAMYQENDSGNYTEINTMPNEEYIINEEKTYCTTDNKTQVKGKIKTVNGKHYITGLTKSDKCYIWFDVKPSNATLKKLNIANYKTTTPAFNSAATTDEGIFKTEDGMYGGTSYYWRGAATTNYVKFAGFCWRIIRINGDGTIRLIYDGATCHANGESTTDSIAVTNQAYNTSYDSSEFVGWSYTGSQRPYNLTKSTASNAKSQTETWYNNNLKSYESKIADGKFCNDRDTIGSKWSSTLSGKSTLYYAARERIEINETPTLSCSNAGDIYTLKVGLITADEVSFAGGVWGKGNNSYYLCNGQTYWTMSPNNYYRNSGSNACVYHVISDGNIVGSTVDSSFGYGIRPVINLKADTTFVSGGTGTIDNPYVVS